MDKFHTQKAGVFQRKNMIVATVALLLVILLMLHQYKNYIKKYKDIEKLPGPSTWDMINIYRLKSSDGLMAFLLKLVKKYGSVVKIWIKPFNPIIKTTDLDFVEKIYKSSDLVYTPSFSQLDSLLRSGIATTKSREHWRNDKHIVNKTLTTTYISDHLKIYDRNINDIMDMIKENVGNVIDVEPLVYKTLTGSIIESLNDPLVNLSKEEVEDCVYSRFMYIELLSEKMNSPYMVGFLHKFTENYKLSLKHAGKMIQFAEAFLKRHKSVPKDQRAKFNLIYAMIDSDMPDIRIIDNINTISQAFDTGVIPLACALHELGKRPDVQQKILDEIRSIIGDSPSMEITLNDLNDMTYLNCVVKESIRLYFSFPFVDRLLIEDMEVKNMIIPKNTRVMFQTPDILRLEENFKNPNVFNPDRFLPENFDENARKAFMPFGFGLKTCPGKNVASAALKLFIAKIVREFEICPAGNNEEIQLKANVVFKSGNGIPVVFKQRNL